MDIKIPAVGESVVEALLAKWHHAEGDLIQKDEAICEIETDKITMDLYAEAPGILRIAVQAGTTVPVGTVIGTLAGTDQAVPLQHQVLSEAASDKVDAPTSPAVRQALREQGLYAGQVTGSGPAGRIVLEDLAVHATPQAVASVAALQVRSEEPPVYHGTAPSGAVQPLSGEERVPMSPLRKRVSERLLQARQQTAMLTTFNEVDLQVLQEKRARSKQSGSPVGLLPFFVRAAVKALQTYPAVNARIDGDSIVYHHAQHIGVAVASDKGLVVPVLRNAGQLGLRAIDGAIVSFVEKIKVNRLALADLEGGTFTISNGGTYGSMLSTPIINPPQSGVLGMHAIQDRAVVRDGQVVVRPMMYLALSYDHRLIDGREAVGFLKAVKERLEDADWLAALVS